MHFCRHRNSNNTTNNNMGTARTMTHLCTTTTMIHKIATSLTGEVIITVMRIALPTTRATTSTDTCPSATMSSWMTMTTMICGESGARRLHSLFPLSNQPFLVFQIFCPYREYPCLCQSRMFQDCLYTNLVPPISPHVPGGPWVRILTYAPGLGAQKHQA